MAKQYRYHRPGIRLEYYAQNANAYEQHTANLPGEQPPLVRDLFPVHREDTLEFASGEADIRGCDVNAPNGNTIGRVEGFLADAENGTVPYAYIRTSEDRLITIPTDQLTMYPDRNLVVLEGGKSALAGAPEAKFDISDADRANYYWLDYRRRNAA